jgi:DNA modification methylase
MQIVYKNINDLKPYKKNARTHSAEQIIQIAKSIEKFGFNNPILVDESLSIIAGHGRLEAAKILKLESIPTIELIHLSSAEKKSYIIADNKIALNAGWDFDILKLEAESILEEDDNFDLELTGFSEEELDEIMNPEILNEGLSDEDEIPAIPEIPISKLGDIWILGNHRLMCGDSTMIDNINLLMNGYKADMVFTDPPYGINEETDRDFASRTRKCKGNSFEKIIGDNSIQSAIDVYNLCEGLKISVMVFWGANYYCHVLPQTGNWLVWDKREEDKQRDMNSDCELAWIKSKAKSVRIFRHLWKGMIKASENGEGRIHPTQKPIALAEWCFNEYMKESNKILDLFGGSGSTLIACEKTNRNCYMMEISEKYCDVIIKRWEKFTGKKAILESTGGFFD